MRTPILTTGNGYGHRISIELPVKSADKAFLHLRIEEKQAILKEEYKERATRNYGISQVSEVTGYGY